LSEEITILVPDIGDFHDVEIIDVAVKPGDAVKKEDTLITLESDKATMDIPSTDGGVIKEMRVKKGDRVSRGTPILVLARAGTGTRAEKPAPKKTPAKSAPAPAAATADKAPSPAKKSPTPAQAPGGEVITVPVPDIGDFHDVEIIDVAIKPGDRIAAEQTLITLESEKATMDIPAPAGGKVVELLVRKGDRVSKGTPILKLESSGPTAQPATAPEQIRSEEPGPYTARAPVAPAPGPRAAPAAPIGSQVVGSSQTARAYASPAVRKFARELGIDLGLVRGSGRKGRILIEDVKSFTKAVMTDNRVFQKSGGFALPEIPPVDFSKFGPVETKELSRLKRLSGQNLHRNWITIPHVSQFDEADITELEEFRKSQLDQATKKKLKLTLLTFLVKAAVVALRKFPDFNSSLSPDGESLVTKQYYNIGFAVNTDQGLMVPVIRDADQKGLFDIARELSELAEKARTKKIKPSEMQGGCFTISSLGHVGGTAFTPIINAPEVAIMGVSRSTMKPVYVDGKFEPRLMLPFTISYDHRVIDGVAAAEFTRYVGTVLSDIREILL
jgi:pyruvate dehydrogenase E2 component (dihydrolipoamide acetyltransferase)